MLLDASALRSALSGLPGWTGGAQALEVTYRFPSFPAAIAFVQAVAQAAEEQRHHPDIDIRYRQVHLRLTSHDAGRVTERDLDLARAVADLAAARQAETA